MGVSITEIKSFDQTFFKSLRIPKAEPWSLPQERNTLYGVSFLLSFFLCAFYVKEKSGKRFK